MLRLAVPLVLGLAAQAALAFEVTDVQKLWALPLPKLAKDAKGRDLVKVRVYPHEFAAPEKRAAEPLDKATLEGACQLYVGKANEVASSGKKIGNLKPGAAAKFNFTVAKLKQPLWLECSGPVKLPRGAPLPSNTYEANFYVYKTDSKAFPGGPHLEVVAVLPLDTYLRGVVPTEVIPSWPADSLKAQAVAARSYAYFNISHNQHFPNPKIYDVDDTNHYQAFSGLTNVHPATDAAVEATKGQILTYKKMTIPAFFDTDHGGQTESAKEAMGFEAPYVQVREEPAEVIAALKPWTVKVKYADLAKGLGAKLIPAGRSIKALSIAPSDVTPGKRARAVRAELDDKKTVSIPIADFRKAAGNLKSALFTLTADGDGVKIDGKGDGHGVGLDQKGAKALAAKGWTYQKILDVYFKDVTLCGVSGAQGVPAC